MRGRPASCRGRARCRVLLGLLVPALLLGCKRPAEQGDAGLARMIEQPRADAFEGSAFFADSTVLRVPPVGTVPRAGRSTAPTAPVRASATEPRAVPGSDAGAGAGAGAVSDSIPRPAAGADSMALPRTVTAALLERGRDRFGIYCAVCHGERADGNSIVGANMHDPAPPSLVTGTHAGHAPAHIYDVITSGSGRMPSYAAELDPEDRWAVVAWVLRLRRP